MSIRVLLVVNNQDIRKNYECILSELGIQFDTVSSLAEMYKVLTRSSYSGIMLDILTKIKETREANILILDVLERFPVIRLGWDDKTKKISALFYGQHQGDTPLEHFINHECRYFRARTIRSSYRHDIHFNITLSRNQDFSSSDVERTITLNASKDGCFIYSSQNWEIRSRVWFVIQELQDQTPISGEIQWCVAWGESMQIPGIGVGFRKVKPCQVEEMSTLCLG